MQVLGRPGPGSVARGTGGHHAKVKISSDRSGDRSQGRPGHRKQFIAARTLELQTNLHEV